MVPFSPRHALSWGGTHPCSPCRWHLSAVLSEVSALCQQQELFLPASLGREIPARHSHSTLICPFFPSTLLLTFVLSQHKPLAILCKSLGWMKSVSIHKIKFQRAEQRVWSCLCSELLGENPQCHPNQSQPLQSALLLIPLISGEQSRSCPDPSVRGNLKQHCCYLGSCSSFTPLHCRLVLEPLLESTWRKWMLTSQTYHPAALQGASLRPCVQIHRVQQHLLGVWCCSHPTAQGADRFCRAVQQMCCNNGYSFKKAVQLKHLRSGKSCDSWLH